MTNRTNGGVRGLWRLAMLVGLIALLGTWPAAWADLAISSADLTGGSPVIVHQSDGQTVRGTINHCTPELLYIMPAPRPGLKSAVKKEPTTQPTEIPWKKINSVSDGLSARLALDIWMAEHRAELCPTCRGERTVWCPTCKGTRHDPASATTCPTCKGELLVPCKTAGETDGQIRCPNSCLKLGIGAWAKEPDGLMWRTFRFGHFGIKFSEHHVGDVMLTNAKAVPPVSDGGACPVCGRTTKVDDPICFGTGQVPCPTCLARTTAPVCPNHCDNGRVVCPTCGGSGLAAK